MERKKVKPEKDIELDALISVLIRNQFMFI
jgi:hypothetical protein